MGHRHPSGIIQWRRDLSLDFFYFEVCSKKNSQEALLLYKLSDWLRVWQVEIKESEKRKDEARM